jgi:glutamate decarboxylase
LERRLTIGTEETYTLNFSRPGAHVIAQYYNFIHLGFEGYSSIQKKSLANARFISKALEYTECTLHPKVKTNLDYLCLSEIHRVVPGKENLDEDDPERYFPGLPVVSFRFTDQFQKDNPHLKQAAVSTLLRVKGWILPNYPLPPNEEKTEILRVVVRESFSSSMSPSCIFHNFFMMSILNTSFLDIFSFKFVSFFGGC